MIFFLVAFILIIVGWLIKYKKVVWLISGYNTASKEKKAQYDIDKLTKHMGNFMFRLAAIYFAMAVAIVFFETYMNIIVWLGFGIAIVVIVVEIIYMNTGNRVKK